MATGFASENEVMRGLVDRGKVVIAPRSTAPLFFDTVPRYSTARVYCNEGEHPLLRPAAVGDNAGDRKPSHRNTNAAGFNLACGR